MKTKLIKKPQFNTIDKLSNIFNLEKPIDLNDYNNIIENHYLEYTNSYIKMKQQKQMEKY